MERGRGMYTLASCKLVLRVDHIRVAYTACFITV